METGLVKLKKAKTMVGKYEDGVEEIMMVQKLAQSGKKGILKQFNTGYLQSLQVL